MQFVMFTKHLTGLSLEELIATLTDVGVAGADLAVRPGYPVNPDNMAAELPRAAQRFRDAGLGIPLVTAPTSLTSPDSPDAEAFYEACGAAGVAHLKLGYWGWDPERRFWDQVAEIREWLATFQEWSRRYGVKTVVHNHSGTTLGMNSSQMMHLVQDFDAAYVGVFADPGHLAVCGEPIAMALEMVRDYLACVACKDLLRVALPEGGWWGRGGAHAHLHGAAGPRLRRLPRRPGRAAPHRLRRHHEPAQRVRRAGRGRGRHDQDGLSLPAAPAGRWPELTVSAGRCCRKSGILIGWGRDSATT